MARGASRKTERGSVPGTKHRVSAFFQRYRLVFQGLAAFIQNANLKGFFTGKPFSGASKAVCVPGLNCYSCPGAVGACPIGSLQSFLNSRKFRFPYYVLGLLIFFGALLGRAVCGFLCPFGLLQDLIHKIPFFKKIRTFKGDRLLRKLKYAVLIVTVIVLPLIFKLVPVFCKYICPSGTISGLLVGIADSSIGRLFGGQFMWKLCILGIIVLLSLLIYRPFCKYLCPLGAFYAPFNKISAVRLDVDNTRCVSCGACAKVCGMGVDPTISPNDTECIRCGECALHCPRSAIRIGFGAPRKNTSEPNESDIDIGCKVIILGPSGSGKSTFARRLHEQTGLPLHHLDNIWWRPDRTHISREEFDAELAKLLERERWIIDGDYSRTYEPRIAACDTVFFLDYSEEQCLDGIKARVGKTRSDIPWTEQELDPELVEDIRNYSTVKRPTVYSLLKEYSDKRIIIFKTRAESEDWISKV